MSMVVFLVLVGVEGADVIGASAEGFGCGGGGGGMEADALGAAPRFGEKTPCTSG